MPANQHPLAEIAELADVDGRYPFRLIVKYDGKLVRLTCNSPYIWIMRKAENGSMLDRWAEADGAHFVKYTDEELARGALHNWRELAALAEDLKTRKPQSAPSPTTAEPFDLAINPEKGTEK